MTGLETEAQLFTVRLLPEEPGPVRDWCIDRVFLDEIEFQCSIAKLAWDRLIEAAVIPAKPDSFRCWDAVQPRSGRIGTCTV